jgi:hypothetical protein
MRLPALVGGAEGGGTHTELVEPGTERQATVNEGNCNRGGHGISIGEPGTETVPRLTKKPGTERSPRLL